MTTGRTLPLFGLVCAVQLAVCGYLVIRWENVLHRGVSYKFITQPVDPFDAFRGRYVAISIDQNFFASDEPSDSQSYTPGQTVYATLATNELGYARFDRLLAAPPAPDAPHLKTTVQRVDDNMQFLPGDILDAMALARRILSSNDVASATLREKMPLYERETLEKGLADGTAQPSLSNALAQFLNRMMYDQDFADRLLGKGKISSIYNEQRRMRRELVQAYPAELAPAPTVRVFLNLPFDRFYMEESLAPRAESAYREHSRSRSAERTFITVRVLKGLGVIENLWIGDKPILEHLRSTDKP